MKNWNTVRTVDGTWKNQRKERSVVVWRVTPKGTSTMRVSEMAIRRKARAVAVEE